MEVFISASFSSSLALSFSAAVVAAFAAVATT
jgi:hypothetical protein